MQYCTQMMLIGLLLSSLSLAQAPTSRPAAGDFAVTPMRVQQIQGTELFLYSEADTTLATIRPTIDKLIAPLIAAMDGGKLNARGPVVFVYLGVEQDPNKPFTLQVGVPVQPSTAAFDTFKTRRLEPLKSATVIYSGALTNIGQAYQQLYAGIFPAGLTPTGENRETYLYWEGPDSANNVVMIQAGVK